MSKVTNREKALRSSADILKDPDTGEKSKACAGSVLSQSGTKGSHTSAEVASMASKTLKDGRTSDASKSAAGSALSQRGRIKSFVGKLTGYKRMEYEGKAAIFTSQAADVRDNIEDDITEVPK